MIVIARVLRQFSDSCNRLLCHPVIIYLNVRSNTCPGPPHPPRNSILCQFARGLMLLTRAPQTVQQLQGAVICLLLGAGWAWSGVMRQRELTRQRGSTSPLQSSTHTLPAPPQQGGAAVDILPLRSSVEKSMDVKSQVCSAPSANVTHVPYSSKRFSQSLTPGAKFKTLPHIESKVRFTSLSAWIDHNHFFSYLCGKFTSVHAD